MGLSVRSGLLGRRRSAETDRFGAGVVEFLEINGEGDLREGVNVGKDEFEFEFEEVEGEGERYLEEICRGFGLIDLLEVVIPLSFSAGNNGGLV